MIKDSNFSSDRKYRYTLSRTWDSTKPKVLFIGLNPSIADENEDDATLTRCINFADSWGYGGLYMLNLFSFVDTYQEDLWMLDDPVGIETDQWIIKMTQQVDKVILAWGNGPNNECFRNRVEAVLKLLHDNKITPYCIKKNGTGMPSHPLYLKSDLQPTQY